MSADSIFLKLEWFEKRLDEVEAENARLRVENEQVRVENEQLRVENAQQAETIKEQGETLKHYADAQASKNPKYGLNYSSQRNEPQGPAQKKKKKKKGKRGGRKPSAQKPNQANLIIDIYPEGVSPEQCVFVRDQFVWRLINHKAQYVHDKIYDLYGGSVKPPTVPGVRNNASEYGQEFLIMLAHHVYWMGLSMDKARTMMEFYTEINISKSQADAMLYQLANDWESEYEEIAKRIAIASILYVDETAWKLGKKSCYTWVFGTIADVYYRCGEGRGKDVLTGVLGEKFPGTGVTDNYAAYDSIFTRHQLCWAHFLRKAIELMLRNPTEKKYRTFYLRLLLIYRKAKRFQNNEQLTTTERNAKVTELQSEITKLCRLVGTEIITEKQAQTRGLDLSKITSESERKLILLQRELVGKLDCLFVFVENPAVGSTNNQSERDLRDEAQTRKAGRTSKTAKGAKRRSTILSVFGTLKRRMEQFSLSKILDVVFKAYATKIPLFDIIQPQNPKMAT
jgi:hypothetical protein